MKGGIFGNWMKEIVSLIFTQTIQAFLLAIVLSIVVSAMGTSGSDGDASTKSSMAGGLLAIIALSQFGKIEGMVKEIFGFKAGPADFKSNTKGVSMAGLAMLGAARRVGDNAGKVVGGAAGLAGNTVKRMYYGHLNKNDKMADAIDGAVDGAAKGAMLNAGNKADDISQNTANTNEKLNQMSNGGSMGGKETVGVSSQEIGQLSSAIQALTDATNKANGVEKKPVTIEEKLKAAKDKQKQSFKKMQSGVLETVGAVGGGIGGAAVGLGGAALKAAITGDADFAGMVKTGAATGVNLGDRAGEKVNNVLVETPGAVTGAVKEVVQNHVTINAKKADAANNYNKNTKGMSDDQIKALNNQIYREFKKSMGKGDGMTVQQRTERKKEISTGKEAYKDIKPEIKKARKFDKNSNANAGNIN